MHPLRSFVPVAAVAVAAHFLPAQTCWHQGSVPMPAQVDVAPTTLGCAGAAQWPHWHLFTPAHREPAPHAGFNPGNAQALPCVLVSWRCTGWLLVPVLPAGVQTMGYVVDRPEHACGAVH